jgi:hypothetical protein
VALGFLTLCALLVLAVLFQKRALAIIERLLRPLSPRIASTAGSMLEAFISAVHVGSGWRMVAFFTLTALYWSLTAWALGFLATAFQFTTLTPLKLAVILTIQVVGVMVPAGPGMIGTVQFFTQAGLSLFDPAAFSARGVAFVNTVWLLQFLVQVGLGTVFLVAGHVSLKGLLRSTPVDDEAPAAAAP